LLLGPLVLLGALTSTAVLAAPDPADPQYLVTDLGALDSRTPEAHARSVNGAGNVVGTSSTLVEGSAQVVPRAFLYRAGQMEPLAPPDWGWSRSWANAINVRDQIAGWYTTAGWSTRAFLFDASDGSLDELGYEGEALALNDGGDVVGVIGSSALGGQAVLVRHGSGVVTNLHEGIPGMPYRSVATGINASGHRRLVWSSRRQRAFRRSVEGVFADLNARAGRPTRSPSTMPGRSPTMIRPQRAGYGLDQAVLWAADGTAHELGVIEEAGAATRPP
jgi:hypothetical protein